MDLIALYTGGKDSHYALIKAVQEGHVVKCLLTAEPGRQDSYMFHAVNARWALLHGQSMGLPHYLIQVSGVKEREVEELGDALAKYKRECGAEGVVTGAIASRYQKERVDRLAERLGLRHISPLWGKNQEELLLEEAEAEEFIIVAAMAMGLDERWLGARVGPEEARRLIELSRRYGFSPVGEGGEFETFVLRSPLLKRSVKILSAEKFWSPSGWGYLLIKEAALS
ncbi:diphthine--ammonia ligase [Thermoproteus tenax]|uniref:ATPase of PP-loop superfamily n=1 Tax=Thermoproteus tenax (strain ATCC 35583 / DSM 2078 / JCM 9277 / NBRC 100435 / Kra 1) TaxID=768679 RepID=G4RMD1_THETK|nr:diphthine--ammonia ligase [Thermoproteus tenax]CCC80762.1 ATPase of PP-loop superfamily [Thermoproteus tenax Kra 1]